ncbi:MAG: HEPN domain-containing protein [Synechococcaceae cyanobacterium]|nr:HEPN domain-containing protein [Synechococcaceae cyanobacterium]
MEKALKGLNLALGQQAWGHTLTRLWAVLPTQDWQPPPPEGLEDSLRLLDGFSIPTRYPDSYPEGTPGEHFGRRQSEQALLTCRCHHRVDPCCAGQPLLRCWSRRGVGPPCSAAPIPTWWRWEYSAPMAGAPPAWAAISICC